MFGYNTIVWHWCQIPETTGSTVTFSRFLAQWDIQCQKGHVPVLTTGSGTSVELLEVNTGERNHIWLWYPLPWLKTTPKKAEFCPVHPYNHLRMRLIFPRARSGQGFHSQDKALVDFCGKHRLGVAEGRCWKKENNLTLKSWHLNACEHRGSSYLIYLENESGLNACHSA